MASSSVFESRLPRNNTSFSAADILYTGTNNTIHCNCSSPFTPPTQSISLSYDIWIILLVISGLLFIPGLVFITTRKGKEKENKYEKTSQNLPLYISPITTSNYAAPQHESFLPASSFDIAPVPPAITAHKTELVLGFGFASHEDKLRQIAEMKSVLAEDEKSLAETERTLDVMKREYNELLRYYGLPPRQFSSLSLAAP